MVERNRVYTTKIDFESRLTPESPFPRWIETDNLYFSQFTPQNVSVEVFYDAISTNVGTDAHFTVPDGLGETLGDAFKAYENAHELWENQTDAIYGMFNTDGDFIGLGLIEDVDWELQRASLGIWLVKDAWGNGHSQERAEALCEVVFNQLDFQLVSVHVSSENKNSISAVTKYMDAFGGNYDGCVRRKTFTPKGYAADTHVWSLTTEEFNSNDSTYSSVEPVEPHND